jgi:hypothetical protein
MFYFYSNLNLSLEELFGSRFLEIPIGILLSLPFLDFPLLSEFFRAIGFPRATGWGELQFVRTF